VVHIFFSSVFAIVSLLSPRLVSFLLLNFSIYILSRRKTVQVSEFSILDQLIIFLLFLLCRLTTTYPRIFTSNFACPYASNCTCPIVFIFEFGAFANYVEFRLNTCTINPSKFMFSLTVPVNLTKPTQPNMSVNTLVFQRKLQENRRLFFNNLQQNTLISNLLLLSCLNQYQ
jgi:hypothetical protein